MTELLLKDVSHEYVTGVKAVDNLNLKVRHGEFFGLLGPSGCGKTTTLKIISGLLIPTEGRVYFDEQDVTQLTPQERDVAMIFQFPVVYDTTVYKNLAFPLENMKKPKEEIHRRVMEAAELLELKDVLNVNARKLDMGTRQRVALGRALVRDPRLFLLDEPLSAVDPGTRWRLRAKLKELQKIINQTMIYVTHDQTEALTLCEKIAVMNQGRIIQCDKPEDLLHNPKNMFVAYFIGSPGMNFLKGSLKNSELDFGEFKYDVSEFKDVLAKYTEVTMGIRPENVVVSVEKVPEGVKMVCESVVIVGSTRLLTLRTGAIEIKAKIPVTQEVEVGDNVWISFPRDKIVFFDRSGERII